MPANLLAFFIALFASLVLAVPVRALALRVGMVDLPGPRKVHLKPIPLLGGLAIYGGVLLGVYSLFQGEARAQIGGILAGATLIDAVSSGDLVVERNPRTGLQRVSWRADWERTGCRLVGRLGRWDYRVVQHPGPHGRLVRGSRGNGFDLLCDARVP